MIFFRVGFLLFSYFTQTFFLPVRTTRGGAALKQHGGRRLRNWFSGLSGIIFSKPRVLCYLYIPTSRMARLWFNSLFFILSLVALGTTACSSSGDGVVLFSVADDRSLGSKIAVHADSTYRAKGQLLERTNPTNQAAYQLLDAVVKRVLNSGQLQYRNEFAWDVKVVRDATVRSVFVTPGGHLYVSSGLLKYLDTEDQLAGVLAHEIAHADRRHASRQLQQQYGTSLLLSLVLGENPHQLAQLAAGLEQLRFSRAVEDEADQYSVRYLHGTAYYASDGAVGFFRKAGLAGAPEFLSIHPNSGVRVEAIEAEAQRLGGPLRSADNGKFNQLKGLL